MIEQGLIYVHIMEKEMTGFFEIHEELEPRQEIKKISSASST